MAMKSAATRDAALHAMGMPSGLYLATQGLNRLRLEELLVTESDHEWWYNPDTVTQTCKLAGLTEEQENVKLTTGHSNCPKCKHDLSLNATTGTVGFFDYFVDNVRIREQFACKKCRHEWGGRCSGAKDFTLVGVAAPTRILGEARPARLPGGGVTARVWEIADEAAKTQADWKTLRSAVVENGKAEGIHPSTVSTQIAKWRKARGFG